MMPLKRLIAVIVVLLGIWLAVPLICLLACVSMLLWIATGKEVFSQGIEAGIGGINALFDWAGLG